MFKIKNNLQGEKIMNFETLTEKEILEVSAGGCLGKIGKGVIAGASAGALGGGIPTLGLGAAAGGFFGAHIGAIGGAVTCLGDL